jgi:hypothetical protein
MPLGWETAISVVLAAGGAYLDHLRARQDDEERERDREQIIDAIERTREDVLTELTEQALGTLRGELEGFQDTYNTYDPDPDDEVEENRLARLIDDSARVIGQLGSALDRVASNPKLALDAWPIYLSLIYLRAQAMTERQVTYGSVEAKDALPSMNTALPRLQGLLAYLRRQSDNRFGSIVCTPVTEGQIPRMCIYLWNAENTVAEVLDTDRSDSRQVVCGTLSDPEGPISKCHRARTRHMDDAYRGFEGVVQITAAAEQLEDARDALETFSVLDALKNVGVDLGDVVVVAENRFQLPASYRSQRLDRLFS